MVVENQQAQAIVGKDIDMTVAVDGQNPSQCTILSVNCVAGGLGQKATKSMFAAKYLLH